MPFIRSNLLDWLNIPVQDSIVIVDEAHNLPDYAREIRSVSISHRLLNLVSSEVEEYGDPEIMEGVSVVDHLPVLMEPLRTASEDYLIEDD